MSFLPIDIDYGNESINCKIVRPIATKRKVGATFERYKIQEMEEFMSGGMMKTKRSDAVVAKIIERRGGILPTNWQYVVDLKRSMETLTEVSLS